MLAKIIIIKHTMNARTVSVIVPLIKGLIRPHLEYCVSAWRPHYVKDIQLLEGVQRRATKLITEFKGLSHYERLQNVS